MKNNKKKILFTSIVTIAICFCLITGSTYALFTSDSEMNIAVTSGNVKVVSTINAVDLYSVRPVAHGETADTVDEFGHEYKFEAQQNGTFANGGTAGLVDGNQLTLARVTPGDKVVLNVNTINYSDVSIKTRFKVNVESGEELAEALVITVKDADGNVLDTLQGLDSFTSVWSGIITAGSHPVDATIEIELPVSTGNHYQHNEILERNPNYEGVSISILVEAVQSNGVVD